MSVGFLLSSPNDAVIWRGPKKNGILLRIIVNTIQFLHHSLPPSLSLFIAPTLKGLIKQFLRDVDWGEVDYLVIDTPPGTSDEHISLVQYLSGTHVDGAILITTPQVSQVCVWSHIMVP